MRKTKNSKNRNVRQDESSRTKLIFIQLDNQHVESCMGSCRGKTIQMIAGESERCVSKRTYDHDDGQVVGNSKRVTGVIDLNIIPRDITYN